MTVDGDKGSVEAVSAGNAKNGAETRNRKLKSFDLIKILVDYVMLVQSLCVCILIKQSVNLSSFRKV